MTAGLGDAYSLDTNVFIESWYRFYPPDIFPTVWENLEGLIVEGRGRSSEEVREDLSKKADDILGWFGTDEDLWLPSDETIQEAVSEILAAHPRLIDTRRNRSGSDPFVIAAAQVHGLVVVTYELPSTSLARPKIPDVCADLGVECISVVELFRREAWLV